MIEDTAQESPTFPSQLFTVRVWWEETDEGEQELRIQARTHVLTGQTRYFRDISALNAYLVSKLDISDTGEEC